MCVCVCVCVCVCTRVRKAKIHSEIQVNYGNMQWDLHTNFHFSPKQLAMEKDNMLNF